MGIIAAEPKCGKTWLALDVAVSVASGAPCLGEFPVENPGTVLFYNGEDAEHIQGARLTAITQAKNVDIKKLKLDVVIADSIKLDRDTDVQALRDTVAKVKPNLLILDPFVRMHGINENNSAKVAELLAKLRQIQKDFGTAVILVHHAKKPGGRVVRAGQRMRGSGELHAWGDANMYLTKDVAGNVILDVELRIAASQASIPIKLADTNGGTAFELVKNLTDTEPVAVASENLYAELSGDAETLYEFIKDMRGCTVSAAFSYTEYSLPRLTDAVCELEKRGLIYRSKDGKLCLS